MSVFSSKRTISVTAVAVLLLAGCGNTTVPPSTGSPSRTVSTPTAPPQVVAAKTAFWPMYTAAHSWASDVELLSITAKQVPGFKNEAGKAAMWEAVFASPSLHQYRTYTYSIATVPPDIYKGAVAGFEQPWGGITRDAMPIDLSLFTVDSDAAYQAASVEAADWLKKNPGKPLSTFAIGDTYKFEVPVWYLMWGNKASGYAAMIDASTGKPLNKK